MKTVIITQARMTSTRLPGKVMLLAAGKPLLEFHLERLQRVTLAQQVVVATTVNAEDDVLVEYCLRKNIAYYRGSEYDVLSRFHGAAAEHGAERVVRVTSDCPLIDPEVVDRVLRHHSENPELDYVSNILERTYPRGLDCEAFSFHALSQAFAEAKSPYEREHVTPFIHSQPSRFRLGSIRHERVLSHHRWTVDTPEDLLLIRKILEDVYPRKPEFVLEDCLEAAERNPDWALLNGHIEQKKY